LSGAVVRRVAAQTASTPVDTATVVTAAYSVTDPNAVAALPSNNEPSSIESSMSDAQVKLIKFVETQIAKMNEHLLFNGQQPTISQLNQALSEYEGILFGLE
jgi:hypothetical protein